MKRLMILFCLLPLLVLPAQAALGGVFSSQEDAVDTDKIASVLPGETLSDIGEPTDGITLNDGLSSLFERGRDELSRVFNASLLTALKILAAGILCSLASFFIKDPSPDIVSATGVLTALMAVTGDVTSLFSLGTSTLEGLATLSKAILPPLTALTVASGSPAAAGAMQFVSVVVSDLVITIMKAYMLPFVYAFVAASALAAALKNELLRQFADLIRWGIASLLKLVAGGFTAYLALSGALASAGDSLTLKAARLTISGGVPVVGSTLSDAAGTILAGAALLKNSLGLYGMLAVLSLCLLPTLHFAAQYLIFKILSAFAQPCTGGAVADFAKALSDAFGLLLAMCATAAFLLIISFSAALAAQGGV